MTRRAALTAFVVVAGVGLALADEKADRRLTLKKQIAETEKKLSELRAELGKVDEPTEFRQVKDLFFPTAGVDVGDEGPLPMLRLYVHEVIDEDTFVLKIRFSSVANNRPGQPLADVDRELPLVLVRGVNTRGWADGNQLKASGTFRVVGTEKHGGSTLYVLRPGEKGGLASAK